LILKYARASTEALLRQCDASRQARRASGGGATKDVEQDLLRAMLVFAAAGLDSLLKQLIRDALHTLTEKDEAVQRELEMYVTRRIRDDKLSGDGQASSPDETASSKRRPSFLARVLAANDSRKRITEEYIRSLTGESLQSAQQVAHAVKALGLSGVDTETLTTIFRARNQIIHDMDIHLEAAKKVRKRRSRTLEDMKSWSEYLLTCGEVIIEEVERNLAPRRDDGSVPLRQSPRS
jgi:hypothetical protein